MPPKNRTPQPDREAEQARAFTTAMYKMQNWRIALCAAGLGLVLVASYPVATAFAGRKTVVDIKLALTFTIAASGLAALFGILSRRRGILLKNERSRANKLADRVRELERELEGVSRRRPEMASD